MELKDKKFEMPKVDIIIFDHEDVITTSGNPNELPGVDPFGTSEET